MQGMEGRLERSYSRPSFLEASIHIVRALGAIGALICLSGQTLPARYAEGQVWEYKTRAGDEGSLLRIGKIENDPALTKLGPIYHISVIGFHFRNPRMKTLLPHAPVSGQTLDASVTKLSNSNPAFPSVDEGIAEWRQARGGVFTISVAEIIQVLDDQTGQQ